MNICHLLRYVNDMDKILGVEMLSNTGSNMKCCNEWKLQQKQEVEWIIIWNKLFHISIGIEFSCYAVEKSYKTAHLNILNIQVQTSSGNSNWFSFDLLSPTLDT